MRKEDLSEAFSSWFDCYARYVTYGFCFKFFLWCFFLLYCCSMDSKKVNYIDFCTNLRNRLLPAHFVFKFLGHHTATVSLFCFQLTLLVPSNVSSDHFSNESVSSFSERTPLVGCHFLGINRSSAMIIQYSSDYNSTR